MTSALLSDDQELPTLDSFWYMTYMLSLNWTTVLLYRVIVPLHILISFKSFKTDWQNHKNYNYQIRRLDIVKQLGWMNVKERYQYFVATFMYKYYHGALPPNVRHSFLRLCDKHHYATRAATSNCLSLPKSHTELLKRSLLYSSQFVWNSQSNHLKDSISILSFKRLYKIEFGSM